MKLVLMTATLEKRIVCILRMFIELVILISFSIYVLSSSLFLAFPSYKLVAYCSSIYTVIVILMI